jgi:hypothetical protein
MPHVYPPPPLCRVTRVQGVKAEGRTVEEPTGEVRRFINVFVNRR